MNLLEKLLKIRMHLYHVLYVSYLLPVSNIGPHIPGKITLNTFEPDKVFVSIVCMKCANVRLSQLPWPSFNYDQLNIRTYVKDPVTGNDAVYFMHSGVTSRMTSYATRLIGIPWQNIPFSVVVEGIRENTDYINYRAHGNWNGTIKIGASHNESNINRDETSVDSESLTEHITGPLIGLIGSGESIMRFGIRHRPLDIMSGELAEIDFPLLNSMGLMEEEDMMQPRSVLLVPEAEFTVLLPPKRI
jgi:hypothetical protein